MKVDVRKLDKKNNQCESIESNGREIYFWPSPSEHIMQLRDYVRGGGYKKCRRNITLDIAAEADKHNLNWMQRAALLTERMCQAEIAVIEPGDNIVFSRTITEVPLLFSIDQWESIKKENVFHELGPISNICADWQMVLESGLLERKRTALKSLKIFTGNLEKEIFLNSAVSAIDAVLELTQRYADAALAQGRHDLVQVLGRVPAHKPRTFQEALQFLRICHSVLWMSSHYHVGLGRFDQYMWPYLKHDLESNIISVQGAVDILAEFFISLNKDSDLYPGIQQGDNGQSLMLGGVKRDGSCGINPLTTLVLQVAKDLCLIDPKINLRINRDTDPDLLYFACELTRKGLGFPQYSNDDIVIPSLVASGYDCGDARDYSVAACWEFIIPGKGMEVVNVGAVSMPEAVNNALTEGAKQDYTFNQIQEKVVSNIADQVNKIANRMNDLTLPPAPYYSVLMTDALEAGKDISQGAKYNNFGIHGACVSDAADALAAVKKHVFDIKDISLAELKKAIDLNYESYDNIRNKLLNESPKIGNNDDAADQHMVFLFNAFAKACEKYSDNGRGGRFRPGTGSAMYFVWLANQQKLGATADGRKSGDYFGTNLAPALSTVSGGPMSVLQSFSKVPYERINNGGPITMELAESVFDKSDSLKKVAMLIKIFTQLGCQQLQLNTLNEATLQAAQKDPVRYRNLIVRVWGWSGYFCELGDEYQRQIIQRVKYNV